MPSNNDHPVVGSASPGGSSSSTPPSNRGKKSAVTTTEGSYVSDNIIHRPITSERQSSPTPRLHRRNSFSKARHVVNAASATGRAAKKLVGRTIKGSINTTRTVVNLTSSPFRNLSSSSNHSSPPASKNDADGHAWDGNSSVGGGSVRSEHFGLESTSKAVLSDIERLAQKSGTNTEQERFKVVPSYAYPKAKFNREELRQEMNRPSSYYHDLRPRQEQVQEHDRHHNFHMTTDDAITPQQAAETEAEARPPSPLQHGRSPLPLHPSVLGSFSLEILQCFGIPRPDLMKETSAFCIAVCGSHAFKTDVMPPVANPMWLSKMRRAVIFPLHEAFARVYLGVFAHKPVDAKDGFIGRVVMDMARLRPGCTYDITLPLRQSSQVYSRQQRGAIRFRYHLVWHRERLALLSYLPFRTPEQLRDDENSRSKPMIRFLGQPHESVTIRCCDVRAFQNVARVVHGQDMPGKFSMKLVKATMREVNFVRIHLLRYLWKQQLQDLMEWRYPVISLFCFVAWMHSVWVGDLRYLPGHVVTYLLLQIWKNYALYVVDGQYDNGFSAPTFEELFKCLLFGGGTIKDGLPPCIEPLSMERKTLGDQVESALQYFDQSEGDTSEDGKSGNSNNKRAKSDGKGGKRHLSLPLIAEAFRDGVPRSQGRYSRSFFKSSEETRVFAGTAAVDFLIAQGYAQTRPQAVEIGLRLQKELKVFEHVSRKYDFKDTELYYVFLNFDTSEYVFKTHQPIFRRLFRWVGSTRASSEGGDHWEFPFASATDHPPLTVKDSLVIRSKESRNLLQTMAQQEMEDVNELGVLSTGGGDNRSKAGNDVGKDRDRNDEDTCKQKDILSDVVDVEVELFQGDSDEELDDPGEIVIEETGNVEVKFLPKPPNQDIDVVAKSDLKIADQMADTRHKLHQVFGHLFHDRTYKLSLMGDHRRRDSRIFSRLGSAREAPAKARSISPLNRVRPRRHPPSRTSSGSINPLSVSSQRNSPSFWSKTTKKIDLAAIDDPEKSRKLALSSRKEEYDRLLGIGKYSNNNVIVSKFAVVVQPIIEMAQLGLSVVRALFNLLTWRDPFLTFWFVLFLTLLVVILHLFPWRIALGVAGFALTGPHNWVMRALKERKHGPSKQNFDILVKKRKARNQSHVYEERFEYFSSFAPDNRPIGEVMLDKSDYKEVAIPYTPLFYRRFYDWPPEPAYARVWSCPPPQNDHFAQQLLEDGEFDVYEPFGSQIFTSTFEDDDGSSHGQSWGQPGLKIARGVRKAVPKQLRRKRGYSLTRVQSPRLESVKEL